MTTKKPARPSVKLVGGHATTTSTAIAQFFGKRHDNVLQAIDTLIKNAPPEKADWCLLNFQEVIRDVEAGKGAKASYREYILSRDAFSLLAMGFTGKDAFAWKIRYIEAFNDLEQRALEKAAAKRLPPAQRTLPKARYHYPRSMLNQPHFTAPQTGQATLTLAMLADTRLFVSPLLALLNQLRSEGHDITAPFDEAVAMRTALQHADKDVQAVIDLALKARFRSVEVR